MRRGDPRAGPPRAAGVQSPGRGGRFTRRGVKRVARLCLAWTKGKGRAWAPSGKKHRGAGVCPAPGAPAKPAPPGSLRPGRGRMRWAQGASPAARGCSSAPSTHPATPRAPTEPPSPGQGGGRLPPSANCPGSQQARALIHVPPGSHGESRESPSAPRPDASAAAARPGRGGDARGKAPLQPRIPSAPGRENAKRNIHVLHCISQPWTSGTDGLFS